MKVLLVIPAYNEAENLRRLLDEIRRTENVDYIVINDCSQDGTLQILKEEGANYIDLPVNLGIGGAVQTGYRYALENGYDTAVQVDGDGQHDIAYLQALLSPIENGDADIVIGSRFLEKKGFQSSRLRRGGIFLLSGLIRILTGVRVCDVTSGFRAVSGDWLELFSEEYPVDYPEPESLVKAAVTGARIREVPVVMRERKGGVSSISPMKSIYYMLKVSIAIVLCRVSEKEKQRR